MRAAPRLAALCAIFSLAGCALPPVQPWEKGDLARSAMQLQGDTLEARFNEHIYASKEAASGGSSVGGGGCGCN
ncbi:DUF4266 domain-containing protein [Massilia endophytica]|uniref:DUF4266 domain-containing protein n=1 Tax=Massilia endophytica TaxID=2899220 RepID=UPI001E55AE36|nr:DUF4266 domain-containing protein [Massilia endophytica]UGQ46912.1 DUF4266 domain-containing protein [Massilia endophytica]